MMKKISSLSVIFFILFLLLIPSVQANASSHSIGVELLNEDKTPLSDFEIYLVKISEFNNGNYIYSEDFEESQIPITALLNSNDEIASDIYNYVEKNNIGREIITTDSSGIAKFAELKAGIYLVAPASYQSLTFSPYIITLPMSENGTDLTDVVSCPKIEDTEVREIEVTVIWDDLDDIDGIRPDSVVVYLYMDGEIIDSVVLSEENNWHHVFTNLPEGKHIYIVNGDDVNKYSKKITGNEYDGFVITYRYRPDESEQTIPQTGENMTIIYIGLATGSALVVTGVIIYLFVNKKKISMRLYFTLMIIGMTIVLVSTYFYTAHEKVDKDAGVTANAILERFNEEVSPIKNGSEMSIGGYNIGFTIEIPSVSVELPVINEWSYDLLNVSPCVYSGSIEGNDLIVLGHSYKYHFRPITRVKEGDAVKLKTQDGVYHNYRVDFIEYLKTEEYDKLYNPDCDLTVFTCTPDSKSRCVLRCVKID